MFHEEEKGFELYYMHTITLSKVDVSPYKELLCDLINKYLINRWLDIHNTFSVCFTFEKGLTALKSVLYDNMLKFGLKNKFAVLISFCEICKYFATFPR